MPGYSVGEPVTVVAPHLAPFTGRTGRIAQTVHDTEKGVAVVTVQFDRGSLECSPDDIAPASSRPETGFADDDGTRPEPGPEPEPDNITVAELRRLVGMSAVALRPLGEDHAIPVGAIGMICAVEGKGAREPKLTLCFVSVAGDPRSGLLLIQGVGQDDIAPALSIRERRRWKG